MPPRPSNTALCSIISPCVRRVPLLPPPPPPAARLPSACLLRPPPSRFASRSGETPRMRYREQVVPNDLGLFAGTFVMPRTPSFFSSPRQRLRLYRVRLRTLVEGARVLLAYKFGIGLKPRPKIAWREMRNAATELHKKMYTALAEGDHATLKAICCEGLYADFKQRISQQQRQQHQLLQQQNPAQTQHVHNAKHRPPLSPPPHPWTLHRLLGSPPVMSSRGSIMQMFDNSAVRQHVVRIRSVQSLDPLSPPPLPLPLAPHPPSSQDASTVLPASDLVTYTPGPKQKMEEYIVIQRRILKGKEGPWLVWGSVGETDAADVLAVEEEKDAAKKRRKEMRKKGRFIEVVPKPMQVGG